jgi:RNA polymerase sigma factor (sigma-70 family)
MSTIGLQIRSALRPTGECGQTDGQLLQSFIDRRDDDAMAAIIHRHGPMVLGVCRRLLGRSHDAEDAFQATFLVLVRKATSIVPRELVGNWLHGVACRTALDARARIIRRKATEKQVIEMPDPPHEPESGWRDLQPIFDQELRRLPEKYRIPVVLCELECRSRKEVARQLKLPEGTLSSRLAMARRILARRLSSRGVAVSTGSLAMLVSQQAIASVPATLATTTIKSAMSYAVGQSATAGISANVVALTEGVLKTMFVSKLKVATVLVLVVGTILGTGAGLLVTPAQAQKPEKPANSNSAKEEAEVTGVVKSIDANTITLYPGKVKSEQQSIALSKDVQVLLDDGTGDKLGFQNGKRSDVVEGAHVTLRLDQKQATRIFVEGQTIHGVMKSADAAKNTVTASVSFSKLEPAVDKTFDLAKSVKLTVDDGQPIDKTKPVKSPALAEIPEGALLTLRMSADRKIVGSIHAQGQSARGTLKAVDPAKSTITLSVSVSKTEPPVDKEFSVSKDASISIDDGKVDKTVKSTPVALGEVPIGAIVTLRQSLDQKSVVAIRAEGANVTGNVEAVDATKNVITLGHKADGVKAYDVAKDVAIFIDGQKEAKALADVPVGAHADLKLSPDGKSVRQIRALGGSVEGKIVGKAGPDSITLEFKDGEKTYTLGKEVPVTVDEKAGGRLADLIEGSVASLRLAANKSMVLEIHARGPNYHGIVKGVDADKDTITLLVGSKNGEGGENKEFKTSKDTVVLFAETGEKIKLSDPRLVDKTVDLRMSTDQKAALRIAITGD